MTNMQDFYKTILDEMETAYALFEVMYGPEGQPMDYLIVETNSAWEKLLDIKGETIYGKMLSEIHKPQAFAKAKQLCDKAVVSRKKEVIDIYLDRFKIWYRTELIPKMHYLIVIVTDVTYFKNLEITTHEKEKTAATHAQLFNSVVEAVHDGICLIGGEGKLLGYNPRFKEMFPIADEKDGSQILAADLFDLLQKAANQSDPVAWSTASGEKYQVTRTFIDGSEGEKLTMCLIKTC